MIIGTLYNLLWVKVNHPVRLRFATARHPSTLEGAGKYNARSRGQAPG
ncbi:MAG: hypothetical protein LBB23_02190 [Rickettsiales bacterium]|nr:hypothetical protein [Rickettsiales bacterium]